MSVKEALNTFPDSLGTEGECVQDGDLPDLHTIFARFARFARLALTRSPACGPPSRPCATRRPQFAARNTQHATPVVQPAPWCFHRAPLATTDPSTSTESLSPRACVPGSGPRVLQTRFRIPGSEFRVGWWGGRPREPSIRSLGQPARQQSRPTPTTRNPEPGTRNFKSHERRPTRTLPRRALAGA